MVHGKPVAPGVVLVSWVFASKVSFEPANDMRDVVDVVTVAALPALSCQSTVCCAVRTSSHFDLLSVHVIDVDDALAPRDSQTSSSTFVSTMGPAPDCFFHSSASRRHVPSDAT